MKKKVISFIIAIVLALTYTTPAFAASHRGAWPAIGDVAIEDFPQYIMDTDYDLSKVWELENSQAVLNAYRDFKPDDFAAFFSGLSSMSSAIGLINGAFTFLKMIGVMENPMTKMLKSILEAAQDIQTSVNRINEKMDKIQTTLNSEFAKIEYEFSQERYNTYKAAWSDFFTTGAVKSLNELKDAYTSQINSEMISFAKKWQTGAGSGVRALYAEDSTLLYAGDNMSAPGTALPEQPGYSYDKDQIKVKTAITLPAEYIVVDNDVKINADNYIEYIEKAFEDGVIKAADENKLVADEAFYTEWRQFSDEEKAAKAALLTADFINSLSYAASHGIANAAYLDRGTFASAFRSNYLNYCKTLQGANGITSPITAALEKLTLTHAFEGEIREAFGDITAMLAMMTFSYGMTAEFLTELDDSMPRAEKDAVKDDNRKTFNVVCGSYDIFMTGYDNYCYPLNALVEYRDALLVSEAEAKYTGNKYAEIKSTVPWSVVDSREYGVSKTAEEKQTAVKNMSGLLSAKDVSVLYYYYQQNGGKSDFMTYLENNNAVNAARGENGEYNTTLITSGFSNNDNFKINANDQMTYHEFGYAEYYLNFAKLEGMKLNFFDEDLGYKYHIHDKATGTLFDVSAGAAGAGSTSDVSSRTKANTVLASRVVGNKTSFPDSYAIAFCDGIYRKTANVPGYDTESLGVDRSSSFKNAVYTVSTAFNYGALVTVPLPAEEAAEETTASAFGGGNIALICGGAALLCAAGFGIGILAGRKKKNTI